MTAVTTLAVSLPGLSALVFVAVACVVYWRRSPNKLSLALAISAVGRTFISVANAVIFAVFTTPRGIPEVGQYSPPLRALTAPLSLLGQLFAILFSVVLAVFLLRAASSVTQRAVSTAGD